MNGQGIVPGRILFVIGSMRLGGAEKQLAMLADELVRRNWQVSIFSLENIDPDYGTVSSLTAAIYFGGWNSTRSRWIKMLALIRAQYRLITLARRLDVHVLQAFLPLTNFLGAIAGWMTRRPLVMTSRRALGTHHDKNRLWVVTDRIANGLSNCVVANSKAVAADTVARDRIDRSKLLVIHNGIEVEQFADAQSRRAAARAEVGLAENSIAIGCLSNLIAYKGHKDLLTAFAELVRALPAPNVPLVLLLAGEDRGMGKSLRAQAEQYGIAAQVRFLGSRDDVPAFLSAVDIGVLPSHEEGFSNALLEMLAAGLPVVATDVGGNSEALTDMVGCALVPASNPRALGAALKNIIDAFPESPDARRARVDRMRTRFPVSAMVDSYVRLYRRFL